MRATEPRRLRDPSFPKCCRNGQEQGRSRALPTPAHSPRPAFERCGARAVVDREVRQRKRRERAGRGERRTLLGSARPLAARLALPVVALGIAAAATQCSRWRFEALRCGSQRHAKSGLRARAYEYTTPSSPGESQTRGRRSRLWGRIELASTSAEYAEKAIELSESAREGANP